MRFRESKDEVNQEEIHVESKDINKYKQYIQIVNYLQLWNYGVFLCVLGVEETSDDHVQYGVDQYVYEVDSDELFIGKGTVQCLDGSSHLKDSIA